MVNGFSGLLTYVFVLHPVIAFRLQELVGEENDVRQDIDGTQSTSTVSAVDEKSCPQAVGSSQHQIPEFMISNDVQFQAGGINFTLQKLDPVNTDQNLVVLHGNVNLKDKDCFLVRLKVGTLWIEGIYPLGCNLSGNIELAIVDELASLLGLRYASLQDASSKLWRPDCGTTTTSLAMMHSLSHDGLSWYAGHGYAPCSSSQTRESSAIEEVFDTSLQNARASMVYTLKNKWNEVLVNCPYSWPKDEQGNFKDHFRTEARVIIQSLQQEVDQLESSTALDGGPIDALHSEELVALNVRLVACSAFWLQRKDGSWLTGWSRARARLRNLARSLDDIDAINELADEVAVSRPTASLRELLDDRGMSCTKWKCLYDQVKPMFSQIYHIYRMKKFMLPDELDAIASNHIGTLERMKTERYDFNAVVHAKGYHGRGFTPLHLAVEANAVGSVKWLLSNVHIVKSLFALSADKKTPIDLAITLNHTKIHGLLSA